MSRGRRASARAACWPALLLLWACDGHAAPGDPPPAAAPRRVRLVPVATQPLPRTLPLSGELAAQETLVLGFQVAGRLRELGCDVGDRVRAGEVVAALDPRDFELEEARARAALRAARMRLGLAADEGGDVVDVEVTAPVREAQAVLRDARTLRDRLRELVAQSLRSQADLDAAEAAAAVAESRLDRARNDVRTWVAELGQREVELQQAQKREADARLLAPWDGQVAVRHAVPGRFLQVGEPVLTLLRIDPLRLRLFVPERLAPGVAAGQRVEFTVDGGPAGVHAGTVARIGAAIDPQNRTLLVEAAVANADGRLRPGGFCRASIVVAEGEPALVVPRSAVQSFAGVDRVFLVEGGKARDRLVETGRAAGEQVEIRSGLRADERVVADPRGLVAGAPVTVGD